MLVWSHTARRREYVIRSYRTSEYPIKAPTTQLTLTGTGSDLGIERTRRRSEIHPRQGEAAGILPFPVKPRSLPVHRSKPSSLLFARSRKTAPPSWLNLKTMPRKTARHPSPPRIVVLKAALGGKRIWRIGMRRLVGSTRFIQKSICIFFWCRGASVITFVV